MRFHGVDLLGDAHRPQLRGEPAAGLHRETPGDAISGASSRVLTNEETKPVAGPKTQQVEEVVALDADECTDGDPEHNGHTGGAAAHHEGAVAPGDVRQQPQEFAAVLAQRDRHGDQCPDEEDQHVAQPDDRLRSLRR